MTLSCKCLFDAARKLLIATSPDISSSSIGGRVISHHILSGAPRCLRTPILGIVSWHWLHFYTFCPVPSTFLSFHKIACSSSCNITSVLVSEFTKSNPRKTHLSRYSYSPTYVNHPVLQVNARFPLCVRAHATQNESLGASGKKAEDRPQ